MISDVNNNQNKLPKKIIKSTITLCSVDAKMLLHVKVLLSEDVINIVQKSTSTPSNKPVSINNFPQSITFTSEEQQTVLSD